MSSFTELIGTLGFIPRAECETDLSTQKHQNQPKNPRTSSNNVTGPLFTSSKWRGGYCCAPGWQPRVLVPSTLTLSIYGQVLNEEVGTLVSEQRLRIHKTELYFLSKRRCIDFKHTYFSYLYKQENVWMCLCQNATLIPADERTEEMDRGFPL